MAKTRKEKEELMDTYSKLIKDSKSIVIVKTVKITPNEVSSLRQDLFDVGAKFNVVKNNIFKIALKESGFEDVDSLDFGEHSVMYTSEDIVSPSKLLKKFVDDTKIPKAKLVKVEVVAGFLDGLKLTTEQVTELADMPNKEQSISMIMGILDKAIGGVVNVLEDAPRSFVLVLEQAFKE